MFTEFSFYLFLCRRVWHSETLRRFFFWSFELLKNISLFLTLFQDSIGWVWFSTFQSCRTDSVHHWKSLNKVVIELFHLRLIFFIARFHLRKMRMYPKFGADLVLPQMDFLRLNRSLLRRYSRFFFRLYFGFRFVHNPHQLSRNLDSFRDRCNQNKEIVVALRLTCHQWSLFNSWLLLIRNGTSYHWI